MHKSHDKGNRKKLEDIKELYKYYFVQMVGRFNCDYEDIELEKFMDYLERKYGFSNLDIGVNKGVELIQYDLAYFAFMAMRIEKYGYSSWEEYMIGTLGAICREVIDFVNVHKKERYSKDRIEAILG